MPASVTCPACGQESTGFYCACGADLRNLFGVGVNEPPAPPSRRPADAPISHRPSYDYVEPSASADGGAQVIGGVIGVVAVIAVIMFLVHTTGWFIFSFKLAKWIVLGAIGLVAAVFGGGGGRGDGRG